jgi:hypothetical protein
VPADREDAGQQPSGPADGSPAPDSASPGAARATILIDGRSVTILPKRAPVGHSGPIRGRTLAVLPALPDPPGARDPAAGAASPAGGSTASPRLRAALPDGPRDLFMATLEPGVRPALAVADLTEAEAAAAGAALGVGEVLFWDGRRARLVDCR